MSLTLEEVEKVARLARLALTEAEMRRLQEQLSAVLDYVDRLAELDISDVAPTTRAVPMQNVLRDDIVTPSLPIDEVLMNASQHAQDQFQIQAVMAE